METTNPIQSIKDFQIIFESIEEAKREYPELEYNLTIQQENSAVQEAINLLQQITLSSPVSYSTYTQA